MLLQEEWNQKPSFREHNQRSIRLMIKKQRDAAKGKWAVSKTDLEKYNSRWKRKKTCCSRHCIKNPKIPRKNLAMTNLNETVACIGKEKDTSNHMLIYKHWWVPFHQGQI